MGGTASVPRDSSQRLKVIGAGYSRTGTSTMQLALEKLLDGPVMHGGTQILTREDAFNKKWVQAYESKARGDVEQTRKLVSQLMAGFVGCADMPAIHFIPEILHLYPDAKVVLVTRDPDRWCDSVRVVARPSAQGWLWLAMWPVPGWRWFPRLVYWFSAAAKVTAGVKPGDPDMEVSPDFLSRWSEEVKAMVPREKLLIMDLKEGWEPLCRFLGVPVPDGPLPRANDSEATEKMVKIILAKLLVIWLGIFSGAALFLFALWRIWTH